MPEWPNGAVSKTANLAIGSGVQIPLSPPVMYFSAKTGMPFFPRFRKGKAVEPSIRGTTAYFVFPWKPSPGATSPGHRTNCFRAAPAHPCAGCAPLPAKIPISPPALPPRRAGASLRRLCTAPRENTYLPSRAAPAPQGAGFRMGFCRTASWDVGTPSAFSPVALPAPRRVEEHLARLALVCPLNAELQECPSSNLV